ncbi:hypothetical protein KC316_g12594 [Hortaea werneckii]|nr:hypothetical protein KC324_g13121 [Hortaea werneckii]KAI7564615.1 hypothetical protein KC316_g12594 [Hortaea werneckii]
MSNQYNTSAGGSAGDDGDGQRHFTFQELDELRHQVQEQEQQLRELEARKTLSDVAQALLGAALQSYANRQIKTEVEVETSEAQGTASREANKALEERLMGMTLPEFKDFINRLVPQATTEADGSIGG